MMALWSIPTPLAVQHDRFRSLGSQFRADRARLDSGDLVTGLLILAVVVLGLLLLSRVLSRQERRRTYNNPRALFRQLSKAHALDRASCRLLSQLARDQQLEQPARLFLEPDRFDPAHLSPELLEQLDALCALRDRIFAQSIDEGEEPEGASPEPVAESIHSSSGS